LTKEPSSATSPFSILKFQPIAEELSLGKQNFNDEPSDRNARVLAVSASDWGADHLKALRVVLLDELSLSRLFPC
jgi:hypothetical protein